MRDDRDYKVELTAKAAGATSAPPTPDAAPAGAPAGRPFINIHFACCNVYLRVYRSADGQAYRARCPKCAQAVNFKVQPGGTDARIFRVE
jgi:hypothetical protein